MHFTSQRSSGALPASLLVGVKNNETSRNHARANALAQVKGCGYRFPTPETASFVDNRCYSSVFFPPANNGYSKTLNTCTPPAFGVLKACSYSLPKQSCRAGPKVPQTQEIGTLAASATIAGLSASVFPATFRLIRLPKTISMTPLFTVRLAT